MTVMSQPTSPQFPEVKKTRKCIKCGDQTDHKLRPSPRGADWHCVICDTALLAYTHAEMMEIVMSKVFGIPSNPKPVPIPDGFKVFIEHPEHDEAEVTQHSVEEHVRLTGTLPKVGKSLYAAPANVKHPGAALPYGKVIRIETNSD